VAPGIIAPRHTGAAAWLAHQRHTPRISDELHIHPQTVRYRIARLRELFGDALESPDGRYEIELALRAGATLDGH
jgi:DNA-binding PucR family transcriptional regulator